MSAIIKVANSIVVSAIVAIQLIESRQIVSTQPENLRDIPDDWIDHIFSILVTGTVNIVGNCTTDPNATKTEYWMHNREHPDGYLITNFDGVDYTKGVRMLKHGWGGNKDVGYIKVIRDAYLQKFDTNVITVDYGFYVAGNYASSYCQVAVNVARFLCELNKHLPLSKVHVVGHSMGGQLAGITGSKVKKLCHVRIGRITELDPAGPIYQGLARRHRLDKTDARFVDVIHTNEGQYGYTGDQGHIDFYPNWGNFQPGCMAFCNIITIDSIIHLPLSYIHCNHQRSCYFFAESILSNGFYSYPNWFSPICLLLPANPRTHVFMGEYTVKPHQKSKQFYMKTNAESPYSRGPFGPMN